MNNDRRTPRAFAKGTAVEADPEVTFPVAPGLVEHLDRQFPITLSLPGAAEVDQAEQRGRQQVIDYLRQLSQTKE